MPDFTKLDVLTYQTLAKAYGLPAGVHQQMAEYHDQEAQNMSHQGYHALAQSHAAAANLHRRAAVLNSGNNPSLQAQYASANAYEATNRLRPSDSVHV